MSKTTSPSFYRDAFNCTRCGVLVPQEWYRVHQPSNKTENEPTLTKINVNQVRAIGGGGDFSPGSLTGQGGGGISQRYHSPWDLCVSICLRCGLYTIWENQNILYPFETELPEPHEDMPVDAAGIYHEAVNVFKHSPRAAAALLRLAIEAMIPMLEEYDIKEAKINTMIGELVKKDIPEHVQQGLDAIRIYGNEGIHPSEIVLNDDGETVMFLFELINIMVEELITRKKKIRKFYSKLPVDKIKGILNRDKVKGDS
jgi:hypothetical protein